MPVESAIAIAADKYVVLSIAGKVCYFNGTFTYTGQVDVCQYKVSLAVIQIDISLGNVSLRDIPTRNDEV